MSLSSSQRHCRGTHCTLVPRCLEVCLQRRFVFESAVLTDADLTFADLHAHTPSTPRGFDHDRVAYRLRQSNGFFKVIHHPVGTWDHRHTGLECYRPSFMLETHGLDLIGCWTEKDQPIVLARCCERLGMIRAVDGARCPRRSLQDSPRSRTETHSLVRPWSHCSFWR